MADRLTATVLCVDDSPDSRAATAMLLRAEGYRVREAGTGTEGLALAREADLVVLDVHLPDLDGFEVGRRLKADPDTALVPVVFLSGVFTGAEDKAHGLADSGDAYLTKPTEPREFLGQVKALLRVRRAEQALHLRDRAIRAVSEGILITDPSRPDHPVTYASPGFERLTGYPADEAVGRNCRFLQGPGTDPDAVARMRAAVRDAAACTVEVLNYRKDGTAFWNAVSISPVRDAAGRVTHFVGVQADVTARKEAEQALRVSEGRYRRLLDSIPEPVWTTAGDGTPEFFNRRWAEYTGLTPPESLAAGCARAVHPDDLPAATARWREALRSGEGYEAEYRLRRADGAYRWHVGRALPERGDDGRVVRWCGTCSDIDGRKKAEAGLRAGEERFRRVVESNMVGTFFWDRTGRVGDANDAFLQIVGHTRDDLRAGRVDWGRMTPPEFRDRDERALAEIARAGRCTPYEKEYVRKGGGRVPVLIGAAVLGDGGGEGVAFALDLTDRRRLEEQFRQAQKMEAVGRLAGGVAHDFNNLLTVISGYSDLMLGRLKPGDPDRELIAEISRAGERAAGLTRQLLAFSRQTVLEPVVLDVNALVRDAERLLRRVIGEDVELHTTLAPDLGRVRADAGQLEQAVVNLVVNARDAMPGGGRLTVETLDAELDAAYAGANPDVRPGRYVLIAVTDTGHGMDAATKARVFEPFFTTKEVGKGTGLGLAMVFGFVKQSGGHAAVYSEPGKGATFRLYMPRVDEPVKGGKSHPGLRAIPRGTETVLLVEDEAGVRALIRHVLQRAGYAVLEAASGRDAVRVAQGHAGPVHLLVTDVVMPGMSGREVADAVRPLHPETRVLYTSGYTDDAVVRAGVRGAEVAFLQKPFPPAALAAKVREVLDGPAAR